MSGFREHHKRALESTKKFLESKGYKAIIPYPVSRFGIIYAYSKGKKMYSVVPAAFSDRLTFSEVGRLVASHWDFPEYIRLAVFPSEPPPYVVSFLESVAARWLVIDG